MRAAFSSRAKEHAAALAALLGLGLAAYGFLLAPGRAPYSAFSDFVPLGLASKTVLYDSVHREHRLPFWRADEFSGNAAWADPQNGYADPLNLPFWALPPLDAAGPATFLAFLAAAAVGYAAALALGLGFWPRLLTAAALMCDYKQALYLELFPGSHWAGAVFVPLFAAAAALLFEKPGARRAAAAGAAGALCLLSGQLQLFYDAALLLGVFFLIRTLRESRRLLPARALWLCAAGALALGLSACVLLPLACDAPLLSRGRGSFELFLSGHAADPRQLLTLLRPEILGAPWDGAHPELWEDVAYFGLAPLALALLGAVLGRRRAAARWLAAGFGVSALFALAPPLQRFAFAWLPGFALFRIPGRWFFLCGWCGVALAGIGLEEALARLKGRASPALLGLAAAALIAAIAGEGATQARRRLVMAPQERLLPRAEYAAFFAARPGPFRVAPIGRRPLNYGWAAPFGLQLVSGFGSYNYARYQLYCDLLRWDAPRPEGARVWTDVTRISRADLLDALNVRYLAAAAEVPLPRARFRLAARLKDQPTFELYKGLGRGDVFVYENLSARPRAYFESGPGEVRVERWSAGELDLSLRRGAPGELIIGEVWNPGWRAALDAEELPLHGTAVALIGALIPPGAHRLELRFTPRGWSAGLGLTASSAAALAALLAIP